MEAQLEGPKPNETVRPKQMHRYGEAIAESIAKPSNESVRFDGKNIEVPMPSTKTLERAAKDRREGKAPTTQAGEFVREEIEHVREGKHGARNAKQAIAIGLSKARRAGVKLPPPRKGTTSKRTRQTAKRELEKAGAKRKSSRTRSRATTRALKKEGRSAASPRALSRQAHLAAKRRARSGPTTGAKRRTPVKRTRRTTNKERTSHA